MVTVFRVADAVRFPLWAIVGAACLSVPAAEGMRAGIEPGTGQVLVRDGDLPVLRYNAATVRDDDVLRRVTEGNRKYARARSGYLHPLYGPRGEVLTHDWPVDHPHHRGIYWAWPEVQFRGELGDLHALQRVHSRPSGEVRLRQDADGAVIEAENLWVWEDATPIVRERVVILARKATPGGRRVDLDLQFVALESGVTLARRETRLYGGLNVRMATPRDQVIRVHADGEGIQPRRAWSDVSGQFQPGGMSGLTVLQHRGNPDYPGDWVQYPELTWCQPTFPAAGTRFSLERGVPLRLRYRLWIHEGPAPDPARARALWDTYHAENP